MQVASPLTLVSKEMQLHINKVLLGLVIAGGIEIYNSTFENVALGKDFPLITLTVGEPLTLHAHGCIGTCRAVCCQLYVCAFSSRLSTSCSASTHLTHHYNEHTQPCSCSWAAAASAAPRDRYVQAVHKKGQV